MTVSPAEESAPAASPAGAAAGPSRRPAGWQLLLLAGLGVVLALALYYPVGAWRVHVVDDDPSFALSAVQAGQSRAVAVAAQLLRREVDGHGWTPNKPFFMPAAILVAMPNFQKGIAATVGRFATEMAQRLGRPAPGAGDVDLDRAAELLATPPDVWMINPAAPWARTLSTEKQYRNAARSSRPTIKDYLPAARSSTRGRRRWGVVLQHFAKDFDANAAALEAPVAAAHGWFGGASTEAYYDGKGRAYAAYLLLRGLGEDDRALLAERGLSEAWAALLTSVAAAALPKPWVVLDGGASSILVPNHLALQGYHLLRARARLADLAEALR